MKVKLVDYSIKPGHHLFIGPRLPKAVRHMLSARVFYREKIAVKGSLRPQHPLFIGPKIPPEFINEMAWRRHKKYKPREELLAARELAAKRKPIRKREALRKFREIHRNDPVHLEKLRIQRRNRMKNNPSARIGLTIRCRLRAALISQRARKSHKTIDLLGCTMPEFLRHLESQFQPGMTWDNNGRGGWHVDHIIPIAAFDLTDPDQQAMCFHYSNQMPLWEQDNLAKGDKITPEAIALIVTSQETIETDVLPVYIERAG